MNLRLKPYDLIVKTFVCFFAALATFLIVSVGHAAVDDNSFPDEPVIGDSLTAESFSTDSLDQTLDSSLDKSQDLDAMAAPTPAEDQSLDQEISSQEESADKEIEPAAQAAVSEEGLVEDYRDTSGLVELHYPIDADVPYKERRPTSTFTFGVSYENFYPSSYSSIHDAAIFWEDMFGESEVPMVSVDIGYKYNFVLGALTAGITGGYGTLVEKDEVSYQDVEFTKAGGYLGYIMDSVFDEPYVAPYLLGGANVFSISETVGVETASGTTDFGFFYKAGALIQLDWIEDETSRGGLLDYGLQNTYLDVFVTQYSTSMNEEDTDTETGINFGAGLKVEF